MILLNKLKDIFKKEGSVVEGIRNLFSVDDAIRTSSDVDSFVNNFDSILSKIFMYEPVILSNSCAGALVFCDLAIKPEHSGIFIGDKTIVELDGSGNIRKVDYSTFLNDSIFRTGINIFTFTDLTGRVLCSKVFQIELDIKQEKNCNIIYSLKTAINLVLDA